MPCDWLIIDGYNLLHQEDSLKSLLKNDIQTARDRLVRMVEETAHNMANQTTIVFDGRESGSDDALGSKYLEVVFSPANLSADSVIERLVYRAPDPNRVLVVTSDRAERDTVSGAGAHTMSAQDFLAQCDATNRRTIPKRTPPGKEPRLGDLFPDDL